MIRSLPLVRIYISLGYRDKPGPLTGVDLDRYLERLVGLNKNNPDFCESLISLIQKEHPEHLPYLNLLLTFS